MASIFKRKADKLRKGSSWYISYTDADGVRRTRKGFTDKTATDSLARQLETDARLRRLGVIDSKSDRQQREGQRPLVSHLDDYHASLHAKGDTPKHVNLTRTYAAKIISLTNAERISDLTPSAVQKAVASLRERGSLPRMANPRRKGLHSAPATPTSGRLRGLVAGSCATAGAGRIPWPISKGSTPPPIGSETGEPSPNRSWLD